MNLDGPVTYYLALHRAIEAHCSGKMVGEEIAAVCPVHAKMLNEALKHSRPPNREDLSGPGVFQRGEGR